AMIAGSVEISPELRARIRPGDTLFVFARRPAAAAASAGSRMPLAVARFPVGEAAGSADWPKRFELSDAMAMAPGAKLSDAGEVEVVARISRTGSAIAASGDATSAPLAVKIAGGAPQPDLRLIIDRTMP